LHTQLTSPSPAPAGKPWNTFCGHIVAISIALAVHSLNLSLMMEKVLTPALAISAMFHLKVL